MAAGRQDSKPDGEKADDVAGAGPGAAGSAAAALFAARPNSGNAWPTTTVAYYLRKRQEEREIP